MNAPLTLTVGPNGDGRKFAVISQGGHPQYPGSGVCEVVDAIEVTGWGRKKINDWYERQCVERPWETRQ